MGWNWLGVVLIVMGAYLVAYRPAHFEAADFSQANFGRIRADDERIQSQFKQGRVGSRRADPSRVGKSGYLWECDRSGVVCRHFGGAGD